LRFLYTVSEIMGTIWRFSTIMLLLIMHSALLSAHREHKVHNIVLYPDKHSWCKTTPIKQVVTWPQCSSQELDNNVCVGACFSYMVPHSEPSAPGDLIRPYCDSCQPLDSVWHTVTLDCKDEQNNPVTMQKKVQIITNCSCSSCMETSKIKPDYNTLLQSLTEENLDKNVNVAHETPDLLLDPNLNASKNTTREFNGTQINERFHQLVKKLKESQKLDESHMKELFSKYEEEVDLEKLKETIKKYTQENKEGQHEHHHQHQHEHQHQHQQQQQQHLHHGPHHSLVLDSDVKEKIDVEPHYLHPAVAGQEISYHDNILMSKEKKKNF
ncbi:NBL1 protein, partial [Acromyrmex heyeri]